MTELVLPLVVRVERATPPARTDALEAAARAVLVMLTTDEPQWVDAIRAWNGQRIRKVVRRARGAEWRRAHDVAGVDVQQRSAEVRVYPPVPIDAWPPELARLQVRDTQLDDPEPPPAPAPGVPIVLLSPRVEMTAGKAMAQAAHAAQLGYRSLRADERVAWQHRGFELAVRDATEQQWQAAVEADVPVVHDGGFTEVEPGTATALFVAAEKAAEEAADIADAAGAAQRDTSDS